MLKCPNCNAEINFDPFNQDVKCYYCGSTFNIVDLENPELKKLEGAEKEKDI